MSNDRILYWNMALLLLISVLYNNVEARNNGVNVFNFSQTLKMASDRAHLEVLLPKQNYLLKLKLAREGTVGKAVIFNGEELKPYRVRQKKAIETSMWAISGLNVRGSNTIDITFTGGHPQEIDVRVMNSRQLFNGDMLIFFDKKILNPERKRIIGVFILLLFIFFILMKCSGLLFLLEKRKILLNIFTSLLPCAFFLLSINMVCALAPFQIALTPLFMKFFLAASFVLIFFLPNIKNVKFMPKFKGLFILLSNVVVFLLLLIIFEAATRFYVASHYPKNIFKIVSPELSYVVREDFRGSFSGKKVVINSHGLRDREHSLQKPPDTYRILFLGDSITFGYGVGQDDAFPAQLQKMFRDNEAREYEAINAAITGYNTYQERLYLEKCGLRYNPDLVIIGVCMNDFNADMLMPTAFGSLINIMGKPYSYPQMNPLSKAQYFLLRSSCFFQYCIIKFRGIMKRGQPKDITGVSDYSQDSLDYYSGRASRENRAREEMFKQELLKVRDLVSAKGLGLLIIIFPNDIQLRNDQYTNPQRMLAGFCKAEGIHFIDLLPSFYNYSKEELFVDIGHPSAFGHRLAAEEIYRYMKNNKI